MPAQEKRRHLRVSADVAAAVVEGAKDPIPGTIANISEQGIFLRVEKNLDVQRKVHLQFIMKPDHAMCEAFGKINWRGPFGVGIFFDDVNDHYRAFVKELVKAAGFPSDRPRLELLGRMLGEPNVTIE